MFRSIVVPLDGTSFGECAIPLAGEIAGRLGAALHLVHVHATIPVASAMESLAILGESLPTEAIEDERAYLESRGEALRRKGLHVETAVLHGALEEALEEYASERADLVVACTHAHQGWMRIWHRSLGEQLVRDVGVPTLLLRASSGEGEDGGTGFHHLLVPLSGSPAAEEALLSAVPLALAFETPITLLQVVQPVMAVGYTLLGQSAHVNDFVVDDRMRRAEAYLSAVAERLRPAGLRVSTRVVIAEEPAHAIGDMVRSRSDELPPIDLVVVATHAHARFVKMVSASVSDSLLRTAPVPILLHRSGTEGHSLPVADQPRADERERW